MRKIGRIKIDLTGTGFGLPTQQQVNRLFSTFKLKIGFKYRFLKPGKKFDLLLEEAKRIEVDGKKHNLPSVIAAHNIINAELFKLSPKTLIAGIDKVGGTENFARIFGLSPEERIELTQKLEKEMRKEI